MKKNIVKLGACSLLVGLLALAACGKKTTTRKDTTVKPTTDNTTTEKVTTKENTTTESKVTTKDVIKEVKDYNVYVDNILCGDSENVLNLEYGDNYNIYKHLKVEKVFTDDTKEELDQSEYEIETNLYFNAHVGTYDLKVNVSEDKSVDISIVVAPKVINISNVSIVDKTYEYTGKKQELEIKGSDNLPAYIKATVTGNTATDAGDYYASITFKSLSNNYVIGNVPSNLSNYKWSIERAETVFTDISNPSKVCNGKPVSINYSTNTGAEATIFYKAKGADDSEYSAENIPSKAGEYTALLVVFNTDNYTGCKTTIDFSLGKGTIKYPTMLNSCRQEWLGASIYTGNEQSFFDQLIGYNPEIMELDSSSDNPNQTEKGEYVYKFRIKDEYKDSYGFDEENEFSWIIRSEKLSDYIDAITCDGENVDIDEFVNLDSVKGNSVYKFTAKEGYRVRIGTASSSGEYSWTANQMYLDLTILSTGDDLLFRKRFYVSLYGIGYVEVEGKKYSAKNYGLYGVDPIMFNISNGNILHISLHDIDEGVTSVCYSKGNEKINLSDFTSELEIDMTNIDIFTLEYTYNGNNYPIIIKKEQLVQKIRAYLYELDTKEILVEDIEMDKFDNDFEIKGSNFHHRNHMILNVIPIFADGVEDVTYKYFERYNNPDKEELDFTKYILEAFDLECYDKEGNMIYSVKIVPFLDYLDLDSLNDGTITTNTGVIEIPSFHNFDIYVDGVKSDDGKITYTKQGVYFPFVEYRFDYSGKTYSYGFELDVIYSNSIFDYAESAGFDIYYNGVYDESAFVEDDGNYIISDPYITDVIGLKNDYLFATTKDGYALNKEKSTFGFLDLNVPEPKYYIKYVFEKDGQEYEVFVWVCYFGDYSENINIVDEKIYLVDGHDYIYTYDLVNDELTVIIYDDDSQIRFDLEDPEASFYVYKDGEEDDDWGWTSGFYYFNIEEGTYEMKIKPDGYAERIVTIHVIKTDELISVIRTNDEKKYALHADVEMNGNLKPILGIGSATIFGYFGDSSEYIRDDKISLDIESPYLSTIYKDENLQINAKASDIYDIYYDGAMPYAILYIKNPGGGQVVKVILYLDKKPFKTAKLTIGSEDFVIVADGTNDHGDLTILDWAYGIDNSECPSTMTLTTTKVYDDYSYAILMDYDGNMYDYETLEELEENGYLYRVTDTTTLSVTIPLVSDYFSILVEGATTFEYENMIDVELLKTFIFSIESESGDKFYYSYKYDYKTYDITEDTNALVKDKSLDGDFSNSLYFKLNENELEKMADGTYKIKVRLGEYVTIFDKSHDEYTPDSDGYVTLPVSNKDLGIVSFVADFSIWGNPVHIDVTLGVPVPISSGFGPGFID